MTTKRTTYVPPNRPRTTPKDPATPPARKRASTKARATNVKAGRSSAHRYTPAERAAVLEQLGTLGMAATHQATGIPKTTLSRWAKAGGVDLGETARALTAKASEALKAKGAAARVSTAERLEQLIAASGSYLATTTGANEAAAALIAALDPDLLSLEAGLTGPTVVVQDADAQAAQKRALALAGLPLETRDAVGILTRAIHDLALVTGQATERGELVVNFGVPRPNALEADVTVVDEAQLAIAGGAG